MNTKKKKDEAARKWRASCETCGSLGEFNTREQANTARNAHTKGINADHKTRLD